MKPLSGIGGAGVKDGGARGACDDERPNTWFHHVRYLVIALGGLVVGSMYFARLSISVAVLAMVNTTHLYLEEHPGASREDLARDLANNVDGEFKWSNELQQLIIGSYMLTYTLPQMFTARLGVTHGIRWTAFVSLLLCGLSCFLMPTLVYWDWKWALVLRMVNGLGASGLISYMIIGVERWFSARDADKGLALYQFVQALIYFVIPLATGKVTAIHWKWGYYAPGLVCLVFALLWLLVVRNSPRECRFVSQKELALIENQSESGPKTQRSPEEEDKRRRASQLPWYFMFKIKTFYAFALIWSLYGMGNGGIAFLVPLYFRRVFEVSVEENGYDNFLIHIGILFSMWWPNPLVAYLERRLHMTLTGARRVVVFVYSTMAASTSLYIALYHDSQVLLLAIFKFFHITNELIVTSTIISQYASYGLSGPFFSMINTVSNLLLAGYCWAVGQFLDYTGESLECWSWVFASIGLMNVATFVLYYLFAVSEPASINLPGGLDGSVENEPRNGDNKRVSSC